MRARLSLLLLLAVVAPATAQKEYGFDNRKGSGQPYLPPEETVRRLQVPPEFEVKLFAAEPLVTNPIAFTIDEKGRVWVIECFEYPKRTPKGKAPRDRIVILEDTNGDGVADKRTVFAEGKDFPVPEERRRQGLGAFDLASGIEVGHGGVFVGAPPYLWFIENVNDKPGRFEILLAGFGSQDTHETLNTFQWGPDGWLYGLHGVFTHSEVRVVGPDGRASDGPPVRLNAAIWRYHPVARRFEIFAEGTSNPWGMDWRNTDGQFILCCCVIPHLYHIVPGGIYRRQAGASFHPYVYGYLNEICDHTFHKESGWAHAGLIALDVPHMPERFRNSVIFGSIHGCSIKQNILEPRGSTYLARRGDDFLRSGDKNFRPINLRWGPAGDIYLIDWHDQHPCHQTHPDDWDYDHGRIYRIPLKGTQLAPVPDLARATPQKWAQIVLQSRNPWEYRTALRLLQELALRSPEAPELREALAAVPQALTAADSMTRFRAALLDVLPVRRDKPPALAADPLVRAFQVRCRGLDAAASIAQTLRGENDRRVLRELASSVLAPPPHPQAADVLRNLLSRKELADDPVLVQLVWLAYEQLLFRRAGAIPSGSSIPSGGSIPSGSPVPSAVRPSIPTNTTGQLMIPPLSVEEELRWLAEQAAANPLLRDQIVPRLVRRLLAAGRPEDLDRCLDFVLRLPDTASRTKALEGMAAALEKQTVPPSPRWAELRQELERSGDPRLQQLAERLAVSFRDPAAVQRALSVLRDPARPLADRQQAVRQLTQLQPPEGVTALLAVLRQEKDSPLALEVLRGLATWNRPEVAQGVLAVWPQLSAAARREAANTLASRREWARLLLQALAERKIDRADLTDNVMLRLQAFHDREIDALIAKHWGRTRPTPAELEQLIQKMRRALDEAPGRFDRGRTVFDTNCGKCHKFDGRGVEVGPALDGAGRDIDYILVNVLDPNRVIGAPYFVRNVTTLDDVVFQGLLAEEDETSITLKLEGGAFKTIRKANIAEVRIAEKSLMPEGLTNNMSVQDFRDLVRYLMAHPFVVEAKVNGQAVTTGVSGRFALPAGASPTATTVWEAELDAPAQLATRLLIGSSADYEVELNGRKLGSHRGVGGQVRPDIDAFEVQLPPGRQHLRITLKTGNAPGVLYVRFLDPDRQLRHPDMPKGEPHR